MSDIYEHAEALKLLAWYAFERQQDEMELSGEIEPDERFVDAQAEFDGKVLSITVNDVLPRRQSMKVFKSASLMREYWTGNVVRAIRKLKARAFFDKALCCIKVYAPRNVEWDVDNRAVSMVINALRLCRVVPNDSFDRLAVLLEGAVDHKRPRTEIRVIEYPDDDILGTLIQDKK